MNPAKRIKIAHKACELVHNKKHLGSFACWALAQDDTDYAYADSVIDFADFYDKNGETAWHWEYPDPSMGIADTVSHQRILAILFWAHCPEIIRKDKK